MYLDNGILCLNLGKLELQGAVYLFTMIVPYTADIKEVIYTKVGTLVGLLENGGEPKDFRLHTRRTVYES